MILDRVQLARAPEMLAVACTSLLVAAWSPAAVPLLRPRLAVRGHAVMEARTMPSGLVYEELTAGTGDSPELEQMVKVRHRGVCVHRGTRTRSHAYPTPASGALHGYAERRHGLRLVVLARRAH